MEALYFQDIVIGEQPWSFFRFGFYAVYTFLSVLLLNLVISFFSVRVRMNRRIRTLGVPTMMYLRSEKFKADREKCLDVMIPVESWS